MSTQRAGFTLVELIIVGVLGAIILGAAVQSLVLQERTYRATGEAIRGQDGLRTALGVLEAELREVATAGTSIGESDIVVATRDSVSFRAQRKLGFVCDRHPSDKRIFTWSLSLDDRFDTTNAVLVFRDGDESWLAARVSQVGSSSQSCPDKPIAPQTADQRVDLQTLDGGDIGNAALVGVLPGAPVRGLQRVTYGLYSHEGEWVLGRRLGAGEMQPLVDGLAGPGEGLVFTYLNAAGSVISSGGLLDFLFPAADVASIRVTARTAPRTGTGAASTGFTSHIFLRNN